MTIELKNESTGVKHFLETINELSNIDSSLNEEVDNFAKSIRDRYLSSQKKEQSKETPNKWAMVAEKMSGVLDDETAEHLLKCSREFRDGFVIRDIDELMSNNEK